MKCVFHDSFIVLNFREMFMIYFLRHFMKYKILKIENFSIMKDFTIEFVSMFD